ncbi:MAG: glycosyltransferase family 2 protein [Planctomycetota bacterium]|nr:MAG: glycosyltransferase family 2 protein [Planctomycetota bacterium]
MTNTDTTLDLCLSVIACDNERTIERTLRSVEGLARRTIVVDSGSTDGTIDICRAGGAEVIAHTWEGHVKQKQFALEQCDTQWVLSLDSDESLDETAVRAVRDAVAGDDPSVAGYQINRRVWYRGRPLRHAWQPEWRTRLVRRDRARWTGFDPHDRLDVEGTVRRIRGNIRHDSFTDFEEFLRSAVTHGLTTARSFHEMGKKGSRFRLMISPPAAVIKQLLLRSAWLDGWPGWLAAYSAGVHAAVKHVRLLELTHRDGE